MSSPPTSDETVRILLVEEYDALALAIELALRKFSPLCEIMRSGNVAEAWEGAQRRPPQLVVLDHDPPSTGVISFFQDLRELAPDARLLLIASTLRRGQITDLGCVGVLRLVEKPFDLQQFGEAVRSQIEPNGVKRLQDFAVSDCVALGCLATASVRLEISSHGKRAGEIDLVRGQITNAETEREKGEKALVELLQVSKPLCQESYSPPAVARSIQGDWIEVLTRLSKRVMPALAKPAMEHGVPRIRASAENQPEPVALRLDPVEGREQPLPSEGQSYPPPSVRSENGFASVAAASPREAQREGGGGVATKEAERGRATVSGESVTMATLELPLDVFAMELTALLKIDLVWARLADNCFATLRIPIAPGEAEYLLETGFSLGEIELDPAGHISTLGLQPGPQPVAPARANGKLAIGGISVAPEEQRWRLFSTANQSLRLHLMLSVDIVALLLSPEVEVSQLTVRCRGSDMRATLHAPSSHPYGGARFRAVTIELDGSRRLQELALAPVP